MENDIIEMGLSLHNVPENGAGSMTSGGTESIIMAMKACRDWSNVHSPVDGTPEIVAPKSVHPAFDKGAQLLGLTVWGNPLLSIVCFGSDKLDILTVGNKIYRRGWMSARTVDPAGINLMISPEHHKIVPAYLTDLEQAVEMAESDLKPATPKDVTYA